MVTRECANGALISMALVGACQASGVSCFPLRYFHSATPAMSSSLRLRCHECSMDINISNALNINVGQLLQICSFWEGFRKANLEQ